MGPTTRRRRDPVTEQFHGTEIADPYRWLEVDDEAVREWTVAQNEYADALLDTPSRGRLRSEMRTLADGAGYGTVEAANGRTFEPYANRATSASIFMWRAFPTARTWPCWTTPGESVVRSSATTPRVPARSRGTPTASVVLRCHRVSVGRRYRDGTAPLVLRRTRGSPVRARDPDEFEFLRAYSPYHNVADDADDRIEYPPVLFTAG
ncbi:hypothetical protein [Halorussus pelagicus]|uniref:hypothetical protein n=1 Tax=Halorussus pelagicus TaxID=2505977 RepID=UPI001AA049E6|nr:hypothetical protein [Halorussus pelagicus]